MVSERVLLSYSNDMTVQIVRPATVCGLSKRMRLDVSVNMLTMQALNNGVVTVFGGQQTRPNIHIDDITDLYVFLVQNPRVTGIYNAGFENISILEIAEMAAEQVTKLQDREIDIRVTPSNDPRSYRINSDKLLATGFRPNKSVAVAIGELISAHATGELIDQARFHNLQWMQEQQLA